MKGKAALIVLTAIGLLALSVTAAQAGAGGSPTLLTGFLVCHGIEGADPGKEFEVESPVFGPGASILQKIKLGKAALACAFARLFPAGSSAIPPGPDRDALAIEPVEPGTGVEQAKCYPITNSQTAKVNPPTAYDALDALVGEETVAVPASKLRFLCAPASFFVSP